MSTLEDESELEEQPISKKEKRVIGILGAMLLTAVSGMVVERLGWYTPSTYTDSNIDEAAFMATGVTLLYYIAVSFIINIGEEEK